MIFRGFGRRELDVQAEALARLARRRGLVLLIGGDPALAARVGAHGVHLPERALANTARLRARFPHWRVTAAVHGAGALAKAARAGVDAALLSVAFPSASPSAGEAMGAVRLARTVRSGRVRAIALGGVNERTAPRLIGTGVVGLAAVEGLSKP